MSFNVCSKPKIIPVYTTQKVAKTRGNNKKQKKSVITLLKKDNKGPKNVLKKIVQPVFIVSLYVKMDKKVPKKFKKTKYVLSAALKGQK